MTNVQMWVVDTFAQMTPVATLMHTKWAWPIAESAHFVGLSLLVGTIFLFDLRLLGVAQRIPMAALHRFIPWGLAGFALTAASGALFLAAEPDQYVYNIAFHLKALFMVAAGLNASLFYLTAFRKVTMNDPVEPIPSFVRIIAAASICLWIGVIVAGRLLTFYRPYPCGPEGPGFLAQCLPGYVL